MVKMAELDTGERPVVYADRVGRHYAAAVSGAHKKRQGQYLTPPAVADFMARLYTPPGTAVLRWLDPGAGAGILTCALCEALVEQPRRPQQLEVVAYETDPGLLEGLRSVLAYTQRWLSVRGMDLRFVIHAEDFVLANAAALEATPRLFTLKSVADNEFDGVILNPPYLKIPLDDPRARAAAAVVHGQPNLYALFMAVGAALLKPGGELLVISPRSYAAGLYFRRFREYFLARMMPLAIHLFGSRREAFERDAVLQENMILHARRADDWQSAAPLTSVRVSFSAGISDLSQAHARVVRLSEVLDWNSDNKVLHIPVDDEDDYVTAVVRAWEGNLRTYGLEISTGPVVPFRAAAFLSSSTDLSETHAPLLWLQNVQAMRVIWPAAARSKPQTLQVTPESMSLLVADRNYVLLRRFSAKEQRRRLTAAPYLAGTLGTPWLALENHLNYIYRPGGELSAAEAYGLAALLNSHWVDTYFRTFNGNTQVSATELRALPLPALETIVAMGQHLLTWAGSVVDPLVAEQAVEEFMKQELLVEA